MYMYQLRKIIVNIYMSTLNINMYTDVDIPIQ